MSETHAHTPCSGNDRPVGSPPTPPTTAPQTGRRRQHRAASRRAPRSPEARRLLCLAVLPPVLVSVLATALVGYLLTTGQSPAQGAPRIPAALPVVALLLAAAVVAAAAAGAPRETRERAARAGILRREVARIHPGLRGLLTRLADDESVTLPERTGTALTHGVDSSGADQLDCLRREIVRARQAARLAVTEAATAVGNRVQLSDNRAEIITALASRLQYLVHREITELDRLQRNIEDPKLLDGFFRVDHLATRVRRHAENLVVLGGGDTRRQWNRPVAMSEVLRSASAEVRYYSRITLVPPYDGEVHGHAAADVIHLLAELLENATVFSSPDTEVLLRTQRVASGVAIEVEDRGTGMAPADRERANALLSRAAGSTPMDQCRTGRVGFQVVAALAGRHDITVQLRSNVYGGVQAVLVLPARLVRDAAPPPPVEVTPREAATPPDSSTAGEAAPAPGPAADPSRPTADAAEPSRAGASPSASRTAATRPPLPRRTNLAGEVRCAPSLEYSVVLGGTRTGTQPEPLATPWTGADWTPSSPN